MKRGKLKSDLQWGESPWDDFTKEELLHELKMYYSALESARGLIDSSMAIRDSIGKHTKRVINKYHQVLTGVTDTGAFKALFRYFDDVAFENLGGGKWKICDYEGRMCKSLYEIEHMDCPNCGHQMRDLRWDDLNPSPIKD